MQRSRRYYVQREPWLWDGCVVHGRQYDVVDNKAAQYAIVAEQKLVSVPEGELFEQPMLTLTGDEAQMLFEALWQVGYRPNKGEASSAHVEAMKYHLEDMRKLVFK